MSSISFSVFDKMLEGVQVIDKDCRYLYLNDAAVIQSRMASRSELVGRTMEECYPGIEQTPLYQRIRECLQTNLTQEWINEFDFPDGSKGFFQLKVIPADDVLLIMSFDVTSQKKAEAFIEATNQFLEAMVKTKTDELRQQQFIIENQLQHVTNLNKTKDRFFAIVAHDLIAPLHSLKGLISVLSSKSNDQSRPEFLRAIDHVQQHLQNTLSLAENLILWTRKQIANNNQPMRERVHVLGLVEEVVRLYGELAERKGIHLLYDIDQQLIAEADKHQLSFVIRNLVNNAIKYTHHRGTVRIQARRSSSSVDISVADNGVGMSEIILEKIQRMGIDRSGVGTIGEKGTGLGLLLCYEFMMQNNGRIDVESVEGQGSTFHVSVNSFATNGNSVAV